MDRTWYMCPTACAWKNGTAARTLLDSFFRVSSIFVPPSDLCSLRRRLAAPSSSSMPFTAIIASFISDVFSNFLRVLKTTRQTSAETIGYKEAIEQIVEKDGVIGLFTRGLGTRVLTNALQASLFTVVWKYLEGRMNA